MTNKHRGKGHGQQIVARLRTEMYRAFDKLEGRGKPIHTLIADQIEQDAEIIDEKETEVVQTRKLVQSIKSLAPKEEIEEPEEPEIIEPEPKPKVYRGKRGRPSKMDLRLNGELDD